MKKILLVYNPVSGHAAALLKSAQTADAIDRPTLLTLSPRSYASLVEKIFR